MQNNNIKISSLLVNNEQYPIGITSNPQFHWVVEGEKTFSQKAFRICVATKKELLDEPDILDTGFIQSFERTYLSPSFPDNPFTKYYWTVSILDEVSNSVVVSSIAQFVTGVLNRSQWEAPFIYYSKLAYYRRIFRVEKEVESAYVFVCSSGDRSNAFNLFINGYCINDMEVRPGPQEHMSAILSGYEITQAILPHEKNVFNIDTTKTFSAVIKINYMDGTFEQIDIDYDWQTWNDAHCLIGYDGLHRGKSEVCNATLRNEPWYQAEDTAEYPCPLMDDFFGRHWGPVFIRYDGVKTQAVDSLPPISIIKGDKGWIVDFGKIQAGYVSLRLDGAKKPIRIQYAEYADEHTVSEQQYAYQCIPYNEYTPLGIENETYHPHFMHTSYRYVQIESEDFVPTVDKIRGIFISSVTDSKSSFSCDNEQLAYLMRCIKRSFMSNLINIPTDCPGRERRGWTADAMVVIEAQAALFDVYNLYDRWFADLHDIQKMSGWSHVEYPESTDWCIDINWPMHTVIIPWALYQQSGNKQILTKNIDCMERYADMLCSISNHHLFADNLFTYGDWVSIVPAERTYLGAAFYAHITDLMAQAERELGNTQKAVMYELRFAEICAAINRVHLHITEESVTYNNGSQSAIVLALAFGICPEEYRARLFDGLVNEIEQTKTITVGFLANTWLYRVLGDSGRNDLALRLLTDTSYTGASMPNMVNRLRNETLNENFTHTRDSLNHAFLGGGPASWVCECLVGVRPLEAGYRSFSVCPYCVSQVPNLSFSMEIPYGEVSISWKKVSGENDCELMVTVPYDTKCKLCLNNEAYDLQGGTHTFMTKFSD